MTLVRERRHQKALRLSLPPSPQPSYTDFQMPTYSPGLSPVASPDSPVIESLSELEKLAVLGHGNGGTVYKVRHKSSSSIHALKVLRFSHNTGGLRWQQAAREAEILKLVDSPHVIRCHGVFDSGMDSNGSGDLCFLMEYMASGSLQDLLRARHRLSEYEISHIAICVLKGLHYLHQMQIVHRDIKPANLLINNREVKIADFGVSEIGDCGGCDSCESYMGTWAYMSPERFDPERLGGGGTSMGFAGDVWSLGVVVLECYMGRFPLTGAGQKLDWTSLMCVICFGESVELPAKASPEFRSFVGRCLEKDWRRRATVDELLQHPFVNLACGSC
ncbi:hypothetical protein UlMin_001202 [Ulmus minor]